MADMQRRIPTLATRPRVFVGFLLLLVICQCHFLYYHLVNLSSLERNALEIHVATWRRQTTNTTVQSYEIPHRIIFTGKQNILETKTPSQIYQNVLNTIQQYRNAWGEPNAPVWFLNDTDCRQRIQSTAPNLLEYFDTTIGAFKADICRVVALYQVGGYYFDIDMQVLQPLHLAPNVTFATVNSPAHGGTFFQSFLASTANNPILYKSFETMQQFFEERKNLTRKLIKGDLLGPNSLKQAYDLEKNRGVVYLLDEINLRRYKNTYPQQQQHGRGPNCNWAVHDAKTHILYFYSRMIGAGFNCMSK